MIFSLLFRQMFKLRAGLYFHYEISESTQAPGMCFQAKPLPPHPLPRTPTAEGNQPGAWALQRVTQGEGAGLLAAPLHQPGAHSSAPSRTCGSLVLRADAPNGQCSQGWVLLRVGAPLGSTPEAGCSPGLLLPRPGALGVRTQLWIQHTAGKDPCLAPLHRAGGNSGEARPGLWHHQPGGFP